MSIQRRAFRIARDVVGIVLDWNDRHLSDKEAMKEITRSLLIHKENENNDKKFVRKEVKVLPEKNKEVVELEEKKEIIAEENQREVKDVDEKKEEMVELKEVKKSFQGVKFEKKLLPPLIISAFFILVIFGIANPYEIASNFKIDTSNDKKSIQFRESPTDDSVIKTEQFLEIPSDTIEKIQNGTKVVLEP